MDGVEKESGRVCAVIVPLKTSWRGKKPEDFQAQVSHEAGLGNLEILLLRYVDVFVVFRRHVLHRRRALQFVPRELAAFESTLQRLKQHDRE